MTVSNAAPPSTVRISLSNDLGTIAFARMVIRNLMPPLDESQEPLFYGALTEIVTNAIEEHHRIETDADVEITVVTGTEALIKVTDSGTGFDTDAERTSDDDSGLGLMISRTVVPGLDIDSGPGGTTVTLPYPGVGA